MIDPDYAALDRPDPTDDHRMLSYTYRSRWGDPTSGTKSNREKSMPA